MMNEPSNESLKLRESDSHLKTTIQSSEIKYRENNLST